MTTTKQKILSDIREQIRQDTRQLIRSEGAPGTIISLEQGNGISLTPTTITSSGTISLDAGISDLTDTQITTLQNGQILSYDGDKWVNRTYPGLSGVSVSFFDLTNVDISIPRDNGNILSINDSGTTVVAIDNNFISSINADRGIRILNNNTVQLDMAQLDIINNAGEDHYIIMHDPSDNISKRQKTKVTNISLFNNDINYIRQDNIVAGTGISIIEGISTVTIGISSGEIPFVLNNASGILEIASGGTGAGTSSGARENLGLTYNGDILSREGPSFRNDMFGNNIILLNNTYGISIINSGSGYHNSPTFQLQAPGNNIVLPNVSIIASGGSIIHPINQTVTVTNIDLSDGVSIYTVAGGNSDATYSLTPQANYLLFGGTSTTGVGFRNNLGQIEVKSNRNQDWQQFYPLSLGGLCDVVLNNPGLSDIIVYNGTSFINATVSGDTKFDVSLLLIGSNAHYHITPRPGTIEYTALGVCAHVNENRFKSLRDIRTDTTIQIQLDNKIGTSPDGQTPIAGDMLIRNTSGTCWTLLRRPGVSGKLLGSSAPHYHPSFEYFSNFFGTSNSVNSDDWQNLRFLGVSSSSEPGYLYNLPTLLEDNLLASDSQLYFNSQTKLGVSLSKPLTLRTYNDSTELKNLAPPSSHPNSLAGINRPPGSGTSLVYSDGTSWFYVNLGAAVI